MQQSEHLRKSNTKIKIGRPTKAWRNNIEKERNILSKYDATKTIEIKN